MFLSLSIQVRSDDGGEPKKQTRGAVKGERVCVFVYKEGERERQHGRKTDGQVSRRRHAVAPSAASCRRISFSSSRMPPTLRARCLSPACHWTTRTAASKRLVSCSHLST